MDFLTRVKPEEVLAIVCDEHEVFAQGAGDEIVIRLSLKAAKDHMGGVQAPRLRVRDEIKRQAFVDQEGEVQSRRPAARAQAMQASMPSSGRDG